MRLQRPPYQCITELNEKVNCYVRSLISMYKVAIIPYEFIFLVKNSLRVAGIDENPLSLVSSSLILAVVEAWT